MKIDMVVTGTRRRGDSYRQQHNECREPAHRPEHPFGGFFDHGALTPDAIEIVRAPLEHGRELYQLTAPVRKRHRLASSRSPVAISR